ncbi:MAG: T9SS type A sorting domain-containing protein, partial [Flavobacteriales bacterium]|nr:T9SS type A sorting domain-containing protein [Flavobacteriales bacterium]
ATTSCDYYNIGETEDYCVDLVDNTIGVGEGPTSGQLRLFPNPFNSTLSLSLGTKKAGVVTCTVRALTGQALFTRTVAPTGGSSSITLDLASLAPGTYLLEMQTGGERIVRKVVKE